MKILFLDMDGVLNDAAFYEYAKERRGKTATLNELNRTIAQHINPVNVYNLRHILKEVPDLRIVISSTWRKYYNLPNMQYMLGKVGIPKEKIIGMTDRDLPPGKHEGTGPDDIQRGDLCLKWAAEHNITEFVCVDDDRDFDRCLDRLVRTNYKNGLTRTKAEEILKLFGILDEEPNMFSRNVYLEDAPGD